MKIQQIFFKNSLRNFSYLLEFPSGVIICIDPFHHELVMGELKERKLQMIINTHDHCDHHSGNQFLIDKYHPIVAAHEKAMVPGKNRSLKHLESVYKEGEFELFALDTPGHTFSHVSLLLKKGNKNYGIFTGDTFFNAGVGNCYNGGDVEEMFKSIESYYEPLTDDVLVYPGHDYLRRNLEFTLNIDASNQMAKDFLEKLKPVEINDTPFINTMGIEREINNFLRTGSREVQKSLGLTSKKEIFIKLRSLRDKW